jgi:hypothetical protein
VKELAPWYDVLNWGKWRHVQLKYSLISQPGSSLIIGCYSGVPDDNQFNCTTDSCDIERVDWSGSIIQYTFYQLITSKSQTCEAIFKGHGIRKR